MLGPRTRGDRGLVSGYCPMPLADLAGYLAGTADSMTRWKLVREFPKEYQWEPPDIQPFLLRDEPLASFASQIPVPANKPDHPRPPRER